MMLMFLLSLTTEGLFNQPSKYFHTKVQVVCDTSVYQYGKDRKLQKRTGRDWGHWKKPQGDGFMWWWVEIDTCWGHVTSRALLNGTSFNLETDVPPGNYIWQVFLDTTQFTTKVEEQARLTFQWSIDTSVFLMPTHWREPKYPHGSQWGQDCIVPMPDSFRSDTTIDTSIVVESARLVGTKIICEMVPTIEKFSRWVELKIK